MLDALFNWIANNPQTAQSIISNGKSVYDAASSSIKDSEERERFLRKYNSLVEEFNKVAEPTKNRILFNCRQAVLEACSNSVSLSHSKIGAGFSKTKLQERLDMRGELYHIDIVTILDRTILQFKLADLAANIAQEIYETHRLDISCFVTPEEIQKRIKELRSGKI